MESQFALLVMMLKNKGILNEKEVTWLAHSGSDFQSNYIGDLLSDKGQDAYKIFMEKSFAEHFASNDRNGES